MIKFTTNFGTITLQLFADKAPKTVANFEQYVRDGHYDGTVFHRVINGFMIQGGGFAPGMIQKPTRDTIENEAGNGLSNKAYTVAMARTMAPHSASAQFFINVVDNDFLDFKSADAQGFGYCVFGEVVEGREVIDNIKTVKPGRRGMHQDVPMEDVIIEKAEII
ncbi:peptidyl-prolyl cis-trans isomerase [Laribacter hongkongensis]|uniref:peptidylprolyl isomerase n=1 Tax=Laribacter hongkongensis TaxID=168471 RepID=UPI001EFEC886|nr:peptidylprolyl isomerase [Laribacter hongkongensis]MCG9009260.1 peptidyl-prolyl cis-trans isomerase [Laribacter hongkongensis]